VYTGSAAINPCFITCVQTDIAGDYLNSADDIIMHMQKIKGNGNISQNSQLLGVASCWYFQLYEVNSRLASNSTMLIPHKMKTCPTTLECIKIVEAKNVAKVNLTAPFANPIKT
jgi:hypothetical protein